ncbi:hypothetical protein [Neorhizobium vignae]|uniref:hypothetical protein n=1 Tax=Neorhizobium vignae TaxID=690585 RepID=UPI001A9A2D30|nr:hypothetical protein [Neorhizobium vignae]
MDRLASAFDKMAEQAEKAARRSSVALAEIEPAKPDPEGTAQLLADSEGNFAANAEVAAVGGIGIKASNTDVSTGKPAQTIEQAGEAITPGAQKLVADQIVGGEIGGASASDASGDVTIPDGWRDLTWQERRSLASKLSDKPISNGEEANAAIEAELKRRG